MSSLKNPFLITGGAGFIGSNLVRASLAEDCPVVNLDALTYAGNLKNLWEVKDNPSYHFVQGSIADRNLVRSLFDRFKPRGLFNLAAESHVDRSIDAPTAFVETNIVGTFVLLDESRKYFSALPPNEKKNFRFLHVSTDEVYGSVEEGASDEEAPYEPNSPYAASKAGADHLVRAYGKTYDLPVLTTNCSNNYGPYQFVEKLIPLVTLNALKGKKLPVYGDGKQVRDWLYVEDHCSALLTIFAKGQLGERYNVSAENCVENINIVRMICRILDRILPLSNKSSREELIEFVKDRPGHDRRYALNASKIRSELNWEPSVRFEEGLEKTVRWYLDHSEWWKDLQKHVYSGERLGLAHA